MKQINSLESENLTLRPKSHFSYVVPKLGEKKKETIITEYVIRRVGKDECVNSNFKNFS